mmetsp:Transcript_17075/g.27394  ORF Transcript_17075/g.27394 Transcript_17075/m.27394 type:complete len:169 (-) Transcript_17075:196-702(-)
MGGIFSCCSCFAPAARADAYVTTLDAAGRACIDVMCAKAWVGRLIGPGGTVLAELKSTTGASIEIGGRGGADPVTVRISGTPAQVRAAQAVVSKLVGEAEHPDYEGAAGKKWRTEADRCARAAEKCAEEKDALFGAGDKAGGREKLGEVKEWQRKMHVANAQVIFPKP